MANLRRSINKFKLNNNLQLYVYDSRSLISYIQNSKYGLIYFKILNIFITLWVIFDSVWSMFFFKFCLFSTDCPCQQQTCTLYNCTCYVLLKQTEINWCGNDFKSWVKVFSYLCNISHHPPQSIFALAVHITWLGIDVLFKNKAPLLKHFTFPVALKPLLLASFKVT